MKEKKLSKQEKLKKGYYVIIYIYIFIFMDLNFFYILS